ncbi:MAG: sensor histidine kinase [Acidimicrobiales bacterium]|nr:sensor histidine kinase [Acidimicrobiales bacterium]
MLSRFKMAAFSDWIGGFIVLSIPIEIGLVVRYQRSAKERAISDAKSFERAELARELHDTVAHHVSAIAVQAQAGRAMAATDRERAIGVLAVIEEAASRTLVEMRSMVSTLRDGAEAELAPQQGLQDLRRLAEDTAGAVPVTVSIDEAIGTVGSATEPALYRIARESITNAVRHASGAAEISVAVAGLGDSISLTVCDDGITTPSNGVGYGLLGMAERAELLGGSFDAGPGPDRGWQVAATIPRTGGQS